MNFLHKQLFFFISKNQKIKSFRLYSESFFGQARYILFKINCLDTLAKIAITSFELRKSGLTLL